MFIADQVQKQRDFFLTNATKDVAFRLAQLKKLKKLLQEKEADMDNAIYADFRKGSFDNYSTELSVIYHELNLAIKKVKKWSRRKRVSTGLANFPGSSFIIPEPLGTVLVIGAWNYPYQVSLVPVISAIAAGNTVILKPSELPVETSRVMMELINHNFPPEYLHVIEGGIPETTELLNQKWDKIFFTGSTKVGYIVHQAAAKNMTPVTLELGGKSPTFVLPDANLQRSAQRIVWAKFLNAGQTCVAPDYILIHESILAAFLNHLVTFIKKYYPPGEHRSQEDLQIINHRNFDRLIGLIDEEKTYFGGTHDRDQRWIEPTIMTDVNFDDKIMSEEIFGPILPVITYKDLNTAIAQVKKLPKPLSCYVFSNHKKQINKLLTEISFGSGAINDAIMQLVNSNLPFGGVGQSGIGSYHGKYGFDTFSHQKSMIKKPNWFEPNIKYPPYADWKRKAIGWLMG